MLIKQNKKNIVVTIKINKDLMNLLKGVFLSIMLTLFIVVMCCFWIYMFSYNLSMPDWLSYTFAIVVFLSMFRGFFSICGYLIKVIAKSFE